MTPLLRAVVGQIDYWWHGGFRPRLRGLTDEEYLWEPAPGCWTLHPAPDGLVVYDHEWPPPQPSPVTTIAWRLCHIAVGCLANRTSRLYPAWAPELLLRRQWEGPLPFPMSADGALDFLDRWWDAWRQGLLAGGEDALWEPIGDREWDIPQMQLGRNDPVIGLVFHVHRELLHHGAEVCLLRDLYRHRPLG
jgi:hypothetical protein